MKTCETREEALGFGTSTDCTGDEIGMCRCNGNGPDCVREFNGGFFITFSHAGFNSPTNNRSGYVSENAAKKAIRHYQR